MKKATLIYALIFISAICNAQKIDNEGISQDDKAKKVEPKDVEERFREYTFGKYYKFDGKSIQIDAIFYNVPGTKEEIATTIKRFYTPVLLYPGGGINPTRIVEGEGVFENLFATVASKETFSVNARYKVSVDLLADGSVKIIYTPTNWQYLIARKNGTPAQKGSYPIIYYAPLGTEKFLDRKQHMEAFVELVATIRTSIQGLEYLLQQNPMASANNSSLPIPQNAPSRIGKTAIAAPEGMDINLVKASDRDIFDVTSGEEESVVLYPMDTTEMHQQPLKQKTEVIYVAEEEVNVAAKNPDDYLIDFNAKPVHLPQQEDESTIKVLPHTIVEEIADVRPPKIIENEKDLSLKKNEKIKELEKADLPAVAVVESMPESRTSTASPASIPKPVFEKAPKLPRYTEETPAVAVISKPAEAEPEIIPASAYIKALSSVEEQPKSVTKTVFEKAPKLPRNMDAPVVIYSLKKANAETPAVAAVKSSESTTEPRPVMAAPNLPKVKEEPKKEVSANRPQTASRNRSKKVVPMKTTNWKTWNAANDW